ncbi:acyl-CoA thioesterase [Leptothoe sp. ISB3NOV94-8A]|uniref:1,4-dihydroxy-2-naphthoyl-CoA hydrolase n=1 Tax=Adonisia turfae CCMR0081 TaxID=2292702 RepID=A0A6M0RN59_9CYAN|nr:acyl-CoA thioesterase [Adonisia turfae]NEZ57300.1 acyl-CoA thioesterase [Adonisia turfae CCMR0081]
MPSKEPGNNRDVLFTYRRTIRFHETDAAGVVYFANILTLCHEAYEAALADAGINTREFFGGMALAVPVVHASVDFRRPLHCGDEVEIALTPHRLNETTFEIRYCLKGAAEKTVATALTRHVCIDSTSRQRHPLSPELEQWMQSATPSLPND